VGRDDRKAVRGGARSGCMERDRWEIGHRWIGPSVGLTGTGLGVGSRRRGSVGRHGAGWVGGRVVRAGEGTVRDGRAGTKQECRTSGTPPRAEWDGCAAASLLAIFFCAPCDFPMAAAARCRSLTTVVQEWLMGPGQKTQTLNVKSNANGDPLTSDHMAFAVRDYCVDFFSGKFITPGAASQTAFKRSQVLAGKCRAHSWVHSRFVFEHPTCELN
jgi:hypothetical protein